MLFRQELYVAEKNQSEYAQALRRAYHEPSLPEHLLSRVFRSLRQALSRVDFPEQEPASAFAQPDSGDRLQHSGPVRG